jgi:hypothetical protein
MKEWSLLNSQEKEEFRGILQERKKSFPSEDKLDSVRCALKIIFDTRIDVGLEDIEDMVEEYCVGQTERDELAGKVPGKQKGLF